MSSQEYLCDISGTSVGILNREKKMTSQNNSTSVCIEKILCSDEPFLVHESNITSNQKMIESLRNECKQLLIDQQAQVHHCVVMTQAEMTAELSLVPSEKNQHNEQCVHILLTLDALQLLPGASHNFFGARFIDKDSAIVVYVRLDLECPVSISIRRLMIILCMCKSFNLRG